MQLLRANTAVDVLIGPFIDDTDGKTAETGLTLSQGDIKLSKNGQALAQKNDDTAAAHDANGYYNCELDTTDTNTEGTLILIVHESGALPIRHEFMVMAEAAWDSMFVAKDDGFMDVNIKTVGRADTQETEADNLESACANYSVTRGLTGTALPAAAADAAGGLPISDAGGLDIDAKLANTNEVTAARMGALTDLIDGGRLDLIFDAIAGDVVNLDGAVMRGTDSAALASVCTEARLSELDAATGGKMANQVDIVQTDTTTDIPAILTTIAGYIDTEIGDIISAIAALNDISAADVKTAMEATGSDLDRLMKALVNKRVWTEATGNLEMFNDADGSLGSIAAQVSSDGTYTTAKRAVL